MPAHPSPSLLDSDSLIFPIRRLVRGQRPCLEFATFFCYNNSPRITHITDEQSAVVEQDGDRGGSGERIVHTAVSVELSGSIALWEISRLLIQYSTIQYNTIQYNTIQYNTIQYNARPDSAMYEHTFLLVDMWISCSSWDIEAWVRSLATKRAACMAAGSYETHVSSE